MCTSSWQLPPFRRQCQRRLRCHTAAASAPAQATNKNNKNFDISALSWWELLTQHCQACTAPSQHSCFAFPLAHPGPHLSAHVLVEIKDGTQEALQQGMRCGRKEALTTQWACCKVECDARPWPASLEHLLNAIKVERMSTICPCKAARRLRA